MCRTSILAALSALLLSACAAAAQPASNRSHTAPASSLSVEGRKAANDALQRLRLLRDGWKDVNRQFIRPNFTAGRRLDSRAYEVQYLEAKTAVGEALRVLRGGELRTALGRAMDLFDDLEEITSIFTKRSPVTTSVRVADVYPYLKKYNVPYEVGVTREPAGLMLHQDFVLSYVLPLRYERINRIEVLLGGKVEPIPPPPTFERMFGIPARKETSAETALDAEEFREVVNRALSARLRGDRNQMGVLLDDDFVGTGRGGRHWDKGQYLRVMSPDPTVKGFTIDRAELISKGGVPTLSTTVRYESIKGETKSYGNSFTFVKRGGRWLIARWLFF